MHGREKWRGETWKRNKKPKPAFRPRRRPKLRKQVAERCRAAMAAERIEVQDPEQRKKARRDRSQSIAQRNSNRLEAIQAQRRKLNESHYQNGTAWQGMRKAA